MKAQIVSPAGQSTHAANIKVEQAVYNDNYNAHERIDTDD